MRTRFAHAASVAAAVAALALGLAAPASATVSATTGGQHYTVVATDPSNGSHITVPLGDRLQLRLTACETCGYHWRITHKPDPSVIAFDKRLKSKPECTNGCTGGNALERWRFTSKGAGTTTVRLGYFPPGKSHPKRVLRLHLDVTS